jgi:hypothetical protein
MSIGGG